MLADIVTKSTLETMMPSGKNLVNTNETYRKCEEKKFEQGRPRSTSHINTWILRGLHNYSVTIFLPLFLAVCFLISMLGVVFLFTTFFLISKLHVLQVFVGECNIVLVVLIFLSYGLYLLITGLTGVIGLGSKRWILFMHSLLAIGVLLIMIASNYYEPRYEPLVLQETEMNMWSSLSKTQMKYHSGWNYIQFNLKCCGVSSFTDWCGCKNVTHISQFKTYSSSSASEDYKMTSSKKITSLKEDEPKYKSAESLLNYDDYRENCSKSYVEPSQNSNKHNKSLAKKEPQAISYIEEKEQYNIVECFIPDSCCIIKDTLKFNPKECLIGELNDGIYNNGCHTAVQHTIKHFLDSFMSLCKFIIIIMMLDLPLAILMIFT